MSNIQKLYIAGRKIEYHIDGGNNFSLSEIDIDFIEDKINDGFLSGKFMAINVNGDMKEYLCSWKISFKKELGEILSTMKRDGELTTYRDSEGVVYLITGDYNEFINREKLLKEQYVKENLEPSYEDFFIDLKNSLNEECSFVILDI